MNKLLLEAVRRVTEMSQREWAKVKALQDKYTRKGWRKVQDPYGEYDLVLNKLEQFQIGKYRALLKVDSHWHISDAQDGVSRFRYFCTAMFQISPKASNGDFLDAQVRAVQEVEGLLDQLKAVEGDVYKVRGGFLSDQRSVTGNVTAVSWLQDMTDESLELPIRAVEAGIPHLKSVAATILKYNQ